VRSRSTCSTLKSTRVRNIPGRIVANSETIVLEEIGTLATVTIFTSPRSGLLARNNFLLAREPLGTMSTLNTGVSRQLHIPVEDSGPFGVAVSVQEGKGNRLAGLTRNSRRSSHCSGCNPLEGPMETNSPGGRAVDPGINSENTTNQRRGTLR
jgi:hypothetical protein